MYHESNMSENTYLLAGDSDSDNTDNSNNTSTDTIRSNIQP